MTIISTAQHSTAQHSTAQHKVVSTFFQHVQKTSSNLTAFLCAKEVM
ncbi:hypothetical protein [Lactococcus garvieae]